nr:hypothetical protein Ade03nite_15890 [Actinoplanes derwentensis]
MRGRLRFISHPNTPHSNGTAYACRVAARIAPQHTTQHGTAYACRVAARIAPGVTVRPARCRGVVRDAFGPAVAGRPGRRERLAGSGRGCGRAYQKKKAASPERSGFPVSGGVRLVWLASTGRGR